MLLALLDKYSDQGLKDLEDPAVLFHPPFNEIGRPMELANLFGGPSGYRQALTELETALYTAA